MTYDEETYVLDIVAGNGKVKYSNGTAWVDATGATV